jgi:hypothetical protein
MAGAAQADRAERDAAVIRDPVIFAGIGQWGAIQTAAPSFGVEVSHVRDAGEVSSAPCAYPGRAGSVACGIRDVDATLEMNVEQLKAISAVICRGSAGEIE